MNKIIGEPETNLTDGTFTGSAKREKRKAWGSGKKNGPKAGEVAAAVRA